MHRGDTTPLPFKARWCMFLYCRQSHRHAGAEKSTRQKLWANLFVANNFCFCISLCHLLNATLHLLWKPLWEHWVHCEELRQCVLGTIAVSFLSGLQTSAEGFFFSSFSLLRRREELFLSLSDPVTGLQTVLKTQPTDCGRWHLWQSNYFGQEKEIKRDEGEQPSVKGVSTRGGPGTSSVTAPAAVAGQHISLFFKACL